MSEYVIYNSFGCSKRVGLRAINELINTRHSMLSNKRFTIHWLDTPESARRLIVLYTMNISNVLCIHGFYTLFAGYRVLLRKRR